ncbi:MAG: DUF1054 domain-containing protein [Alicyclobacillus sp.]|nr:DUF1054 domain-containing protein [Alicyclobacillus sp.]
MPFRGFEAADFEVFEVPGLERRMEALQAHLRPKLVELGELFAPQLAAWTGRPFYAHVAKHARRTVNPPNDSWVAFCEDKRGYKKHPHFQIGAWATHAFALFGVIYESPARAWFARQLVEHAEAVVRRIPGNYVFVPNHMDTAVIPASEVDAERLCALASDLQNKRHGELLVGIQIRKEEAVAMSGAAFAEAVAACFETLLPLYALANTEEIGVELV